MKNFKIYIDLLLSLNKNKIIFYLQKIPYLGLIIPTSFYGRRNRLLLKVIQIISKLIQVSFKKLFYFAFIMILNTYVSKISGLGVNATAPFTIYLISFILGSAISDSIYVDYTNEDSIIVKSLKMNHKRYLLLKALVSDIEYLLLNGIVFSLVFILYGQDPLISIPFILNLLAFRKIKDYINLTFYEVEQKIDIERILFLIILLVLGLYHLFAYKDASRFFDYRIIYSIYLLPVSVLIYAFISYKLFKNKKIREIALVKMTNQSIKTSQDLMADVNEKTYGIKMANDKKEKEKVTVQRRNFENLSGAEYVNRIFYDRIKFVFIKKIAVRSLLVLSLPIILSFFADDLDSSKLEKMIGQFGLFAGYLFYLGDVFIKYSFFNMDRFFLKSSIYRRNDILLRSLKERFKMSLLYNLPILLSQLLGIGLLYFMVAKYSSLGDFFIIVGLLTLIMVFYSVNYLILYYLFQPFNEAMAVKSIPYQIASGFVYLIALLFYNNIIEITQTILIAISAALLVYIVAGSILVFKIGPKRFRLKD